MSSKNCLVLVYQDEKSEPFVVRCPKDEFFSKKDAQRTATAHVKSGASRAEVVEKIMDVKV